MDISFKIDWFSVTIHPTKKSHYFMVWKEFFQEYLGELQDKGHGGRGFKGLWVAELGSKIYVRPTNGEMYFNIELPGQACACIPPERFRLFLDFLLSSESSSEGAYKFKVTRIDFAFDNVPFTPQMFLQAIEENKIRSLTQRESTRINASPFKLKEDSSSLGTTTIYFGSSQSTRKVRVYDKRGPTRLELELRDLRSDHVARAVLTQDEAEWMTLAVSHVRDFMDIYETEERETLAAWWQEFIDDVKRAYMTIYKAKEISKERIETWFETQIASWLFVLNQLEPQFLEEVSLDGSKRLKPHHKMVLAT
jgi:DNA relaxase NicK